MVRSLGWARAAALIGVIADASKIAPTRPARSRRFQGARVRYSRRTCSGSACAAPLTTSAVLRLPAPRALQLPAPGGALRAAATPAGRRGVGWRRLHPLL